MALFGTLQKGSRGDEVRKLQTSLTTAGYDVGASGIDGIYGPATEKAVVNYQKDKGLQADGIAGAETLGSLYGEQEKENHDPEVENRYQQALKELEGVKEAKPQYAGTYESRLEELYNRIVNRQPFSYDRENSSYLQARDQYRRQGQLAMLDTLGQAAGLTGGYSNSYAQSMAQQAYQGYLEKLGQLESELYARAKDSYNQQGQSLLDQYGMLENLSQREYDRYRDALSQYNQEISQGRNQANDAYDRWLDARELDAQEKEYLLAVQKYLSK